MDRDGLRRPNDLKHLDSLLVIHRDEYPEYAGPAQVHQRKINAGETFRYLVKVIVNESVPGYVKTVPRGIALTQKIEHRAHDRRQCEVHDPRTVLARH